MAKATLQIRRRRHQSGPCRFAGAQRIFIGRQLHQRSPVIGGRVRRFDARKIDGKPTSIAFIAGTVPLVLSSGAGAEVRSATGITVFAGMLGVTLFGLFLTPVFYVALRKLVHRPLVSHAPAHAGTQAPAHPAA